MTNATKALILGVVNTALGLAVAFGLELSAEQIGALVAFVNAVATLIVGLTYKSSPKRIPG